MNSTDIEKAHKLSLQRNYISDCVNRLQESGGSIQVTTFAAGGHQSKRTFDIPIELDIIIDALNEKHIEITNEMEDMGVVFREPVEDNGI
jgi:hypothetical protein